MSTWYNSGWLASFSSCPFKQEKRLNQHVSATFCPNRPVTNMAAWKVMFPHDKEQFIGSFSLLPLGCLFSSPHPFILHIFFRDKWIFFIHSVMRYITLMLLQSQMAAFSKWTPTGSAVCVCVCAHAFQETPRVCVWRLPSLLLRPSDNDNESIVAAQITRLRTLIWLCESYLAHIWCALLRWRFCTFPASRGDHEDLAQWCCTIAVLSETLMRLCSSIV